METWVGPHHDDMRSLVKATLLGYWYPVGNHYKWQVTGREIADVLSTTTTRTTTGTMTGVTTNTVSTTTTINSARQSHESASDYLKPAASQPGVTIPLPLQRMQMVCECERATQVSRWRRAPSLASDANSKAALR
jgi:hypothetical protein